MHKVLDLLLCITMPMKLTCVFKLFSVCFEL